MQVSLFSMMFGHVALDPRQLKAEQPHLSQGAVDQAKSFKNDPVTPNCVRDIPGYTPPKRTHMSNLHELAGKMANYPDADRDRQTLEMVIRAVEHIASGISPTVEDLKAVGKFQALISKYRTEWSHDGDMLDVNMAASQFSGRELSVIAQEIKQFPYRLTAGARQPEFN